MEKIRVKLRNGKTVEIPRDKCHLEDDYREQMMLTPEKMKAINDAMPAEAKYGDVFKEIAQAQLDNAFSHPITRPCRECGGEGEMKAYGVTPRAEEDYKDFEMTKCPFCTDGVETTTLGKLEEEWVK